MGVTVVGGAGVGPKIIEISMVYIKVIKEANFRGNIKANVRINDNNM